MPDWVQVTLPCKQMAYGTPLVIDIKARYPAAAGEYTGCLHLRAKDQRQDESYYHSIPFHVHVHLPN